MKSVSRCVKACFSGSAARIIRSGLLSIGTPVVLLPSFLIGFVAPKGTEETTQARWLGQASESGGRIVRIGVAWREVASGHPPVDAGSPSDQSYDFSDTDRAVRHAVAQGLQVLLTVHRAPSWAEGREMNESGKPGTWKPESTAYENFATAIARRYSGTFQTSEGVVPEVRYFQAWNEPNLATYLGPQWEGGDPASPKIYRGLLNAFYEGIKRGNPDATVVTAGTAPYGDPPGHNRMRPLKFWREVLCLKLGAKREVVPKPACPEKAKFDVLAHHPISVLYGPRASADHPDDAITMDFKDVRATLRAAERAGTVLPTGRRPLWATEMWFESDPPDGFVGVPLMRQARWIEEAFYLLWRQGASVAILLQIVDQPYDPQKPHATLQSGVFFANGKKKPSFTAVRFPFVGDRTGKRSVRVWGKAPVSGTLTIQRRHGGGWTTVKRLQVAAGSVFDERLRLAGKQVLRGRLAGERSLTWAVRR